MYIGNVRLAELIQKKLAKKECEVSYHNVLDEVDSCRDASEEKTLSYTEALSLIKSVVDGFIESMEEDVFRGCTSQYYV